MLHIVLYQPEIPPNTGNIIRICANTGHQLHLIQPLGFTLDDKRLKRAGLDYHELVNVHVHTSFEIFMIAVQPKQLFAFSTKGKTCYTTPNYQEESALLFGPETRGLPQDILSILPATHVLRLPMKADSRSMNLSNAVAVALYEAWRHLDFSGGK